MKRFAIRPKIFLYVDEQNMGWFGINTIYEDRLDGDMQVISGHTDNVHQYFERNKTFRFSAQLSFTYNIDEESKVNLKNTIGYFDWDLSGPGLDFKGSQLSSYFEVNYVRNGEKAFCVGGANLITDYFAADPPQNNLKYNQTTIGVFVQNTYKVNNWFSVESGLRLDINKPAPAGSTSGLFLLPRINALFKITE
ncbi:TonB-dependent receptor domain-containing protein [Pedobacter fastidiosus]